MATYSINKIKSPSGDTYKLEDTITVNSNDYPIVSRAKTTQGGVQGLLITYSTGASTTGTIFLPTSSTDTHLIMTPSEDTLTCSYSPVGNANTTSY